MPASYKNAATAVSTSVTLPSHAVGDLILIYAYRGASSPPSVPAAGGTVPTWTTISSNTGTIYGSMRVAYAVATATDTTTGTWTNASRVTAVIITGQSDSPIGGSAEADATGGSLSTTWTAPAVTMQDTSGNSVLVHVVNGGGGSGQTFNAAPSGYTARLTATATGNNMRVLTKDTTTTDGSVTQTVTTVNYARGASVEILSPKTGFFAFF